MSLSALQRRRAIVDSASTSSVLGVEQLARRFNVTASTIRRDLARLEEEGVLARTYGGVRAVSHRRESTLAERLGVAHEAKQAIARRAAQEIGPGETVLLDAGTTVAALAHELREAKDLHVVAAGLTALEELGDTVTVELLGGQIRSMSQGLVGPLAEATVEKMTFDRAFLGADGIDPEFGLNEGDLRQTRLKELIASRAKHLYVLAHHSKITSRSLYAWAKLSPPWTLITDAAADPAQLERFRAVGVTVRVVET